MKCLHCLFKICGRQALVPRSLVIPLHYNPRGYPLYQSASADVWRDKHEDREVAVKALRVYASSDLERMKKRFCREVMAWRVLCHPNVVSLSGVIMAENRFVMVSEWLGRGNINEFLKVDKSADRLRLLKDATTGLIYMHDQGAIHGNIRGANILINDGGRACLADFGLLRIISDESNITATPAGSSVVHWTSPELLVPHKFKLEDCSPTKESDCYSLGMTMYEVLSGRVPFSECSLLAVTWKIVEGERPTRPQGAEGEWFTDDIWGILEHCWKPMPEERIRVADVLQGLESSPRPFRPSPDVDASGAGGTNVDN